jgi:hypothetical protein
MVNELLMRGGAGIDDFLETNRRSHGSSGNKKRPRPHPTVEAAFSYWRWPGRLVDLGTRTATSQLHRHEEDL